jgi:four helix bundle protein
MEKQGLNDLLVWRKARELAVFICKEVLPQFPKEERYALEQQLRRSVQSIPANIAEAYGRYTFQEGLRFLYIARGSLEETYSHLILAEDLEYISRHKVTVGIQIYQETARLLNGYIEYIKRSKGEPNRGKIRESNRYEIVQTNLKQPFPDP